jgi:hypothetical protein
MAKRLQVDLSEDDYDKLRQLAKGRSLADVVRRALSTEAYVEERKQHGARLVIEEEDGTKKELVTL